MHLWLRLELSETPRSSTLVGLTFVPDIKAREAQHDFENLARTLLQNPAIPVDPGRGDAGSPKKNPGSQRTRRSTSLDIFCIPLIVLLMMTMMMKSLDLMPTRSTPRRRTGLRLLPESMEGFLPPWRSMAESLRLPEGIALLPLDHLESLGSSPTS